MGDFVVYFRTYPEQKKYNKRMNRASESEGGLSLTTMRITVRVTLPFIWPQFSSLCRRALHLLLLAFGRRRRQGLGILVILDLIHLFVLVVLFVGAASAGRREHQERHRIK